MQSLQACLCPLHVEHVRYAASRDGLQGMPCVHTLRYSRHCCTQVASACRAGLLTYATHACMVTL